ncbi:hypothetical protein Pmar_PMAR021738 [Perkinsus marinus ATCC 50983]|uniref:AttH domain-containing protein n=1 Tax=Perkinsus marinus (strain ATCC 50983 / TXsc) TaxID=423536 RepID=C5L2J4_PERM5|nr:hypothetical protein Pmar_PMAR021738 [Perkinsus marinus ATCC 50983]EER09088.1 hypothetical protein Pmar_PMAR021738 [Perkinsus marinus ATCC 50983]|eukprot:XP_002777272.1 hypothetical protein Pmar_PMAR021738 [Perkinsus marinus ATCC 50983]
MWSAKSLPLRIWLWYVTDEGESVVVVDYQSRSLSALQEVSEGQIRTELGLIGSLVLHDDVDDPRGVGELLLQHEGNTEMIHMHFATEGLHYPWEVTGQEEKVIHRPFLRGDVVINDEHILMHGYSKRYYGPSYGPVWGYRFIHTMLKDESTGKVEGVLWTADATFGKNKYNYWKLLNLDSGKVDSIPGEFTFHQQRMACSLCEGKMKKLTVNASVVHEWTLKGSNMLSEMSEAFGVAELTDSTGQVLASGPAFNEICYGSLG